MEGSRSHRGSVRGAGPAGRRDRRTHSTAGVVDVIDQSGMIPPADAPRLVPINDRVLRRSMHTLDSRVCHSFGMAPLHTRHQNFWTPWGQFDPKRVVSVWLVPFSAQAKPTKLPFSAAQGAFGVGKEDSNDCLLSGDSFGPLLSVVNMIDIPRILGHFHNSRRCSHVVIFDRFRGETVGWTVRGSQCSNARMTPPLQRICRRSGPSLAGPGCFCPHSA
ncbi:hypothetical protein QO003_001640 [Arthrobacter silviterrae]|nr:hypothetical protein [Arthrobacter silviterrae]